VEGGYVVFKRNIQAGGDDLVGKTLDLNTECVEYKETGWCSFGWRCRFLGSHIRRQGDAGVLEKLEQGVESVLGIKEEVREQDKFDGWELVGKRVEEERDAKWRGKETNWPRSGLLEALKKSEVCLFPLALKGC